jgi:hypothetical protein
MLKALDSKIILFYTLFIKTMIVIQFREAICEGMSKEMRRNEICDYRK